MKLPFIYALRGAFPSARITWVAGTGTSIFARELAPLVAGQIDEVLENARIGSHARELVGPRPLAGRRFDLVIDTQRHVRTTLILRRIRHRRFLSAAAGFLFSDLRPRPWLGNWRKPPSVAAQLRVLIELASGRAMPPMPPLPLDPALESRVDRLLPPGAAYVGFAPGAGGRHKRWPLDRFLAVAAETAARGFTPVFFLGPAEMEWVDTIRAALPGVRLPLQETSEISPLLTIAAARRMRAAVSNDCGTGHLLAAADIPLVSLFGPTRPEKFAPAASRLIVVQAQRWGGEAMQCIPTEAVGDALRTQLGSGAGLPDREKAIGGD